MDLELEPEIEEWLDALRSGSEVERGRRAMQRCIEERHIAEDD